jgi:AcrR family transcriptional regulator
MTPATTRMRADERRDQVLDAAVAVFARHGYEGTSTEEVAKAAGISQPYLFRLFETKRALFLELVRRGFERVGTAFAQAAGDRKGEEALRAMGDAYLQMLADRDLLLLQLHAYAACDDHEVRAATRRAFADLWRVVSDIAELPAEALVDFFAHGMLLNVVAAMDATELREAWVRACLTPDGT